MNAAGVWLLIIFFAFYVSGYLRRVFIAEKVESRIACFIIFLIHSYTIYCLCNLMRLI